GRSSARPPSGALPVAVPAPVVVHLTKPSGFALPYASRTVATINVWESTSIVVVERSTSKVVGAPGTMVTACRPVLPAVVAVTKPVPTVVDAVNAPVASTAPTLPVTPQVSVAPVIGL